MNNPEPHCTGINKRKVFMMALVIFLSGIICGITMTHFGIQLRTPPSRPPRFLRALESVAQTQEEKQIISREIIGFLIKNREKSVFAIKQEIDVLKENLINNLPPERKDDIEEIFKRLSQRLEN